MRLDFGLSSLLLMTLLFSTTSARAQVIADNTVIPPVTVLAPSDRPLGPFSGILDLDGVSFGERFSGQTVNPTSPETVSGSPSGPLVLLAGADETNLQVGEISGVGRVAGCGPAACDWFDGALSFLLDEDVAELSVDFLVGGFQGGTATIRLYARDGTLLFEGFTQSSQTAGFRVEGGPLIAGATFTVAEQVQGVDTAFVVRAVKIPASTAAVPLPPTLPVLLIGSLVLCGIKRLGVKPA